MILSEQKISAPEIFCAGNFLSRGEIFVTGQNLSELEFLSVIKILSEDKKFIDHKFYNWWH